MIETDFIVSDIKKMLENTVDDRDPSNITMSSLGHCARQLAYRFFEIPGRPLPWRSYMVFEDGDMAHEQLRKMIVAVLNDNRLSCYELNGQEDAVAYEGIPGHIDGYLKHDGVKCQNPEHCDMLLEVKSMNDRAFTELKKTKQTGFEYRCQVSGYLAALGLKKALILGKNKNNGDIKAYIYEREDNILKERVAVVEAICLAKEAEEVNREYSPNSRGNLPWQCGYCPFVQVCWRDFSLVEKKENKWQIDMKLYAKGGAHGDAAPSEDSEGKDEEIAQC